MGIVPRPLIPVLALFLLTLVGLFVLVLPFSHREDGFTPFMDALFAATSATTTTGLTTQDLSTFWAMPGQITLLILTFIGGLVFLVVASLLLIHAGQRISSILQEDTGERPYLGNRTRLGVHIALVVVGIQFVGFLVLLVSFSLIEPTSDALWKAFTMTVLAFNNGGFIGLHGVEGEGALSTDWAALTASGVLVVLGAVGTIVLLDIGRKRRWSTLSLNTKIVLGMTGIVAVLGAATMLVLEFENPATIGDLRLGDKVAMSAFEAVAGRVSGLTTIDYAEVEEHTSLFMMGLMFVGGASASVAGGIKVNTLMVLMMAILSAAIGRRGASAFKREISFIQIKHAMTLSISMIGLTILAMMILTFVERGQGLEFIDLMFETVSAASTAGLSTGLSSDLSGGGKLLMAAVMFVGRVLPLSLAIYMIGSMSRPRHTYATERVTIG
ncbi:MAG: hypothetical protein OXD46_12960 [Chloroflexi bacterium]|nr:hypothetical protein [Chloroflexota bacterium]